jgi:predicted Zn-dependent protease
VVPWWIYIVVPARLILTTRNEAEFAGMLAHAMAHVAQRHRFRPATHSEEIPGRFIAGADDSLVSVADGSIQRANETEEYVLAVKMIAGAACNPEDLVRDIGRTQPADSR